MIIHVCGAVGSGKTTLGNKLAKNKNLVVKDLDRLLNGFVKKNKFTPEAYQKYIYKFIDKHSGKPIVFVGINQDMGRSRTFYDLKADKKMFIDLDVKENAKRRFIRDYKNDVKHFFLWRYPKEPTTEEIYNQWIKNEKVQTARLHSVLFDISPSGMEKDTIRFRNMYKKRKYIFIKPNVIYDKIMSLVKDAR